MGYEATERPRIGWIGAGRMGFQLAKRLLDAGHDVTVYNRTRAKAEPLAEFGASIVDTPVELADRDVVFVTVSASDDLTAVTEGPDGVLTSHAAAPGLIVDSPPSPTRRRPPREPRPDGVARTSWPRRSAATRRSCRLAS
jgi:3-hydroxyisobutyrate dehydrogenase-like beta-hydroxyacid dehydrogenase